MCVEVSATLGLIELLSQSDPLLVYCTSHTHIKFKSAHWRMSLPSNFRLSYSGRKRIKADKKEQEKDKIQAVDAFNKEINNKDYSSIPNKQKQYSSRYAYESASAVLTVSLPGQAARWSVFMMILIYIALCLAQNFIPPCQINTGKLITVR